MEGTLFPSTGSALECVIVALIIGEGDERYLEMFQREEDPTKMI